MQQSRHAEHGRQGSSQPCLKQTPLAAQAQLFAGHAAPCFPASPSALLALPISEALLARPSIAALHSACLVASRHLQMRCACWASCNRARGAHLGTPPLLAVGLHLLLMI